MENDNLLSDIEDDIGRDWNDIRKSFLQKELDEREKKKLEKKKDNPQRPHIPDYKLFNDMMLAFIHNPDDFNIIYDLRRMFMNLLYDKSDYPMPESFNEVWRMFCSPMDYDCATDIQCLTCHSIFDIIYEKQMMIVDYNDIYRFNENHQISSKTTRAYCPNCGSLIINVMDCKIIGVFEKHTKERK